MGELWWEAVAASGSCSSAAAVWGGFGVGMMQSGGVALEEL